jgi:hypothetical protein
MDRHSLSYGPTERPYVVGLRAIRIKPTSNENTHLVYPQALAVFVKQRTSSLGFRIFVYVIDRAARAAAYVRLADHRADIGLAGVLVALVLSSARIGANAPSVPAWLIASLSGLLRVLVHVH